jgi:hypothetical protein
MKRLFYKYIVSVLAILSFISCEKEVNNIKYPEFKPKWDISGYLSPDNLMSKIIFSQNLRNYGNPWQIEDMGYPTVTLSDGTNLIVLDSVQMSFRGGIKKSDFPIEEGKTYTLKIITDKGFNAEASCTVPFRGKFDLDVDTTITRYLYEDSIPLLTVHPSFYFTDTKGVDNYYMVLCEEVSYSSFYNQSNNIYEVGLGQKAYFNDKGIDGLRTRVSIEGIGLSNMTDSCFLKIYLLNTDKVYYDYKKSIDKYNSGEDPFTEPSPVYSNISGGLGIFAAYTVDSLIYRLK